jgi:UDPglucose 6-dehydrogenase
MKRAQGELPASAQMKYAGSVEEATADADAMLVLTDWPEFAALDLEKLHQSLRYPIVIDGRNLYDPQVMVEHGFTYMSVGRPAAMAVREPAETLQS